MAELELEEEVGNPRKGIIPRAQGAELGTQVSPEMAAEPRAEIGGSRVRGGEEKTDNREKAGEYFAFEPKRRGTVPYLVVEVGFSQAYDCPKTGGLVQDIAADSGTSEVCRAGLYSGK